MSRSRTRALALGLVAVLVSACGGAAEGGSAGSSTGTEAAANSGAGGSSEGGGCTDQQVTLEFPNFQAAEAPFSVWWDEFIPAFEEEYPNVTIDYSEAPTSPVLAETLQTRFAAGNPPDIIHMTTSFFAAWADAGWLRPLGDMLADTQVEEEWPELQETFVWEGEPMGVMTLSFGWPLFYNEQLLADAGVDVPTTPEELIAASQAVHDPDEGRFGFAAASAPEDTKMFTESSLFVLGEGGTWFDGATPLFDTPEVISALEDYREAVATAPPGIPFNQRNELFLNGQAAFMVEGPYFWGTVNQEAPEDVRPNLKVAPPPFENVGGVAAVFLALPSTLEGCELEAAENFVKMAVSQEWQEKYTEIVRTPAPDPDALPERALEEVPELELFAELNASAVNAFPLGPAVAGNWPLYRSLLERDLGRMHSTDEPVADMMSALQAEVEQQIESS